MPTSSFKRAFSLIELLFVLALVSLLAALLFPVFLTLRGQARQTVCLSNLQQMGLGVAMYQQDYEGRMPYAVSPDTRVSQALWQPIFPEFAADIPHLPQFHTVMQPYLHPTPLFRCPADSGFEVMEKTNVRLEAFPTSYEKFGTSYFYLSVLAACASSDVNVRAPEKRIVLFDPVGFWHGSLLPLEPRTTFLFMDGHVQSLNASQTEAAKGIPINLKPGGFVPSRDCS